MNMIAVPAKFYDDHGERGLPTPEEIRRSGSRVWIRTDDPAIPELLSDARFYADRDGPDYLPPGLKASAARTVAAMDADAAGEQNARGNITLSTGTVINHRRVPNGSQDHHKMTNAEWIEYCKMIVVMTNAKWTEYCR
jgi:hypothetical protein